MGRGTCSRADSGLLEPMTRLAEEAAPLCPAAREQHGQDSQGNHEERSKLWLSFVGSQRAATML